MAAKKMKRPEQGLVFWPVGNGDSTTICISASNVMQVDLRHLEKAEDEDDPHVTVVDELVQLLPRINDKPYLAAFALSHPDEDHCQGFKELLRRVSIGELWFTPRVFREYQKDLCDDAKAFRKEAMRRVDKNIAENGETKSGDRVRIIGYDDLLEEEEFEGLPANLLTVPGNAITMVDGTDHEGNFRAFVHAPFKDDSAGERNETSLGMQVTLSAGEQQLQALLLGDLSYPTIRKIFDVSKHKDVRWHALLAPHHCSKSVMYWDNEDGDEELKRDILDSLEAASRDTSYVLSSSEPVPSSNKSGDNPPHAKAKRRYEEITDEFLCTQEHPTEKDPQPIVLELSSDGIHYRATKGKPDPAATVGAAAKVARGDDEPPTERVGFGRC